MKTLIAVFILLVIVIGIGSVYFLVKSQEKNSQNDRIISDFNNMTYNFLDCESSCPLETANVKNVSHTLPETNCMKKCLEIVRDFKAKYPDAGKVVNQNISSKLIAYSTELKSCEELEKNSGNWTAEINTCIKQTLPTLKERYDII